MQTQQKERTRNTKAGTNFFTAFFNNYLPDAFAIAVSLAIVVFLIGIIFTDFGPLQMIKSFSNGMPSLYSFGMQMSLILITGHALANSRQVNRMLTRISGIPKTATQGIVFTAVVCMILNYINWGLGMIGGAMLAKQVAAKNRKIHYPLLIALVYGATIIRGFSTSIPLVVATPGHFLEESLGIIPITQTMFSSWNLVISGGLVVLLALLGKLMMPKEEDVISIPEHLIDVEEPKPERPASATFAQKFSRSRLLSLFIGILLLIYCFDYFMNATTFNISINIVIALFMAIGIILHGDLVSYKNAIGKAVRTVSGILLQFPIYAGIMAMMKDSGVALMISEWFVSVSSAGTFPVTSLISASFVNIFIPSGGGQWAVQAPVMMPAAAQLGADTAKTVMGIAWGDALTNQIQPFWALPILGVAGLEVKDIMGYCAAWCLTAGIFIAAVMIFM